MTPNWPTKLDLIHNTLNALLELDTKLAGAEWRIDSSDYRKNRTILNLDWHEINTLQRAVASFRHTLELEEKKAQAEEVVL